MAGQKTRRDALKTIASTGVLLAGGAGTAAARNGKRKGASGDDTIVEVAVEADDFNTLVTAVQEAGLADTLSGNRQLTVFAPTDEAFGDLLDTLDISAGELLERDDLADILTYHVTPGRRYAASVVNAPRVGTLNGADIEVAGTDLNGGGDALGGGTIVDTNIEASNGVIHKIDGVLLP